MKRSTSQMNSFFVEIIIVIMFFAISVTVILQLFMAANNRAQQSSDLGVAVIKAQNIAEQIKGLSSSDDLPKLLKAAKRTGASGGTQQYQIAYDKQWNETQSAPRYVIDITMKKTTAESGVFVNADILVSRCKTGGENQIYKLNSAKYLPKTS